MTEKLLARDAFSRSELVMFMTTGNPQVQEQTGFQSFQVDVPRTRNIDL